MKESEIKELHLSMLCEVMDKPLARFALTRSRRSTKYTRSVDDGAQRIDMIYTVSHSGDDSSLCHIQPIVSVELRSVNAMALEMVGGSESLLGTPKETTLAIPLGFLGPERTFKDWRPLDDGDYRIKVAELAQYVEEHAVPFLDGYRDAEAIVAGYANRDDRLVMALQPLAIRATAAAVCCSQQDKARSFVESAFKKAGPRRQYQCVFDYLDKLRPT